MYDPVCEDDPQPPPVWCELYGPEDFDNVRGQDHPVIRQDYYSLHAGWSTESAGAEQPHLVDHHRGVLHVSDPAGLAEALLEEEEYCRCQPETNTDQDRVWYSQR